MLGYEITIGGWGKAQDYLGWSQYDDWFGNLQKAPLSVCVLKGTNLLL